MKTRLTAFLCAIAFLFVSPSLLWSQDSKPKHALNILPDVEPEMLTPEYWIALKKDADEVIMTPEVIERFNEKVRYKRVIFRDYYGKPDPEY